MERFLIVEMDTVAVQDGDGSNPRTRASMRVASERQVSDRIDMADCYGDDYKVFYLADDGTLQPVTVANHRRSVSDDEQTVYAWADLVAGGVDVGTVNYSDH